MAKNDLFSINKCMLEMKATQTKQLSPSRPALDKTTKKGKGFARKKI